MPSPLPWISVPSQLHFTSRSRKIGLGLAPTIRRSTRTPEPLNSFSWQSVGL